MDNDTKQKLIQSLPKILSGRFLLTIVASIVFFEFCTCLCDILVYKCDEIEISDILNIANMLIIIVSNIFTFYFTRERYNKPEEKKLEEVAK